jgi:hypothetical protein
MGGLDLRTMERWRILSKMSSTILNLLGLDDAQLTYFHGASSS